MLGALDGRWSALLVLRCRLDHPCRKSKVIDRSFNIGRERYANSLRTEKL